MLEKLDVHSNKGLYGFICISCSGTVLKSILPRDLKPSLNLDGNYKVIFKKITMWKFCHLFTEMLGMIFFLSETKSVSLQKRYFTTKEKVFL